MSKKKAQNNPLHGNKRDNEITGTDGDDNIEGRGGDDTIYGLAGNDQLWGDSAGTGSGKGSKGSGSHKGSGSGKGSHKASGSGKGSHKASGSGKGSHKGSKGSGSAGDDYLDGGAGNDNVWAGAGDDSAAYNVGENEGSHDEYDGGKGTDTLVLLLAEDEYQDDTFEEDLTAYLAILADETNQKKEYQFQAFDLEVQNFEELAFGAALVDDEFSHLVMTTDAEWIRMQAEYVYVADVLDNDIGVKHGNKLADDIEIRLLAGSKPETINSITWDEDELVFLVFIGASTDGNTVVDEFEDDFNGDENDPAGVSFAYEALQNGVLIDSATVTLIG
jgi:hypothetical protein